LVSAGHWAESQHFWSQLSAVRLKLLKSASDFGASRLKENMQRKLKTWIERASSDQTFLHGAEFFENLVAKILLIAIVLISLYALLDLTLALCNVVLNTNLGSLGKGIISIFGLFLNLLIALELLENITGYLRKHVLQVELVIVTAIIAVARKLVILDLEKTDGIELLGLAVAILTLTLGYWVIRVSHRDD
jgi:uncharacterized membrane protein (DUF373 family)